MPENIRHDLTYEAAICFARSPIAVTPLVSRASIVDKVACRFVRLFAIAFPSVIDGRFEHLASSEANIDR